MQSTEVDLFIGGPRHAYLFQVGLPNPHDLKTAREHVHELEAVF